MNDLHHPDNVRTTCPVVRFRRSKPDTGSPRLARTRSGYRDGMRPNVLKKSLAVLVSGAALFLTLGAGCENEGDGENGDQPGVEQQDEQEQDGEQQDEQDGDN